MDNRTFSWCNAYFLSVACLWRLSNPSVTGDSIMEHLTGKTPDHALLEVIYELRESLKLEWRFVRPKSLYQHIHDIYTTVSYTSRFTTICAPNLMRDNFTVDEIVAALIALFPDEGYTSHMSQTELAIYGGVALGRVQLFVTPDAAQQWPLEALALVPQREEINRRWMPPPPRPARSGHSSRPLTPISSGSESGLRPATKRSKRSP